MNLVCGFKIGCIYQNQTDSVFLTQRAYLFKIPLHILLHAGRRHSLFRVQRFIVLDPGILGEHGISFE